MLSCHFIGFLSVLLTITTVSNQSSFKVVCDFGDAYYPSNTTAVVNGSLKSQFSSARNCSVKHEVKSAIVRVTVARFNSSNLTTLYSMVLENFTVLFAYSYDLVNSSKYHFHACPRGYTQNGTSNDLNLLFFGAPGNESFTVKVELDNSVLKPDEITHFSVRSDGLAEVKAFDIEDKQLSSLLQITVTSEDTAMECLLIVSQSCFSAQSQGLTAKTGDKNHTSIKLTFTEKGRITLSQYSSPKISAGRWYIGIRSKIINKESNLKNVNVTVKQGYTYDMRGKTLPTVYMCIITILGGIVIGIFAHFFLNPDFEAFDESSFPFLMEEAEERNRRPSKGILEYVPEPIPRSTFPMKQWVKVICVGWFGQGIKTYPYVTGVLAISFMVGSAQFVIARWSNMISEGNRDLCYYNEFCYRPIAFADMPSNFMLSNVPYVIHGVFLTLSFSFREAITQEVRNSRRKYSLENARRLQITPYDYSVAYALAWALIFEGLFSATYHLCPSRLTFQFDSAFMFIISGLVVVALFNCRVRSIHLPGGEENSAKHPSTTIVQAPKYFLFFVVPLLVFNYVGSIKNTSDGLPHFLEVSYWIALVLWLIIMYIWTFQKVGVPCSWKMSDCRANKDCWKMEAIIKWVWLMLFPFCLLIIGIKQKSDWSQFFLFSCVAAVALVILGLMSFDTAVSFKRHRASGSDCCGGLKQLFDPKRICAVLVRNWHRGLFIIATFIFWVFAMYYFKIKSTTRKVKPPSVSRTFNEECVLWDFFGYHDIWHMLSSFALFMSAYLLIYVTRKVEILSSVETMYWKDKNKANGRASSTERMVQPRDLEIVLEEKQPVSAQPTVGGTDVVPLCQNRRSGELDEQID